MLFWKREKDKYRKKWRGKVRITEDLVSAILVMYNQSRVFSSLKCFKKSIVHHIAYKHCYKGDL